MPATLAFQTAFGPAEIALLVGDGDAARSVRAVDQAAGPGQDGRLPSLLEGVLAEGGAALGDVERIGVVTGPGSFTGLRMGLAFARGLGLVLGCPVFGVSLLAACVPVSEVRGVRVALQAQKRPPDVTFWSQAFDDGVADGPPEELGVDAVAGDGRVILTDRVDLFEGSETVEAARPLAEQVARRVLDLQSGEAPPDPIYVRAPDAALPGSKR
ncbi:MAG: tRNA (adenosine(37)-N6)-threonylcarbamoyltransferase complex dimerization subunit type 1 TsaB [Pseudomonadota bacterium]